MEENKFWLALWIAGMITVIGIAGIVGAVTVNSDNRKVELIKGGADPIAVTCAMGNSQASICTIITAKQ